MLTFYHSPGSSSMAVHVALHETGAPFEAHVLSLQAKDTRTPGFLAINPNGRVPTLVIDGRVLTEVAGCLWYLARAFPAASLLPEGDVEAEAQVVSWMSFLAASVHTAGRQGPEAVDEAFTVAEKRLAGRPWTVGDRYSIADIHLFRLYWRFKPAYHLPDGKFPAVEALHARVLARPAVRKTIAAEAAAGYSLPTSRAP